MAASNGRSHRLGGGASGNAIAMGIARVGQSLSAVSPSPAGGGWPTSRSVIPERWLAPVFLLLWLILPPSALYLYSLAAQPIFGPARYTVFVAPAYLILVALGLNATPPPLRYALALVLTVGLALLFLWTGLAVAYFTLLPVGFVVTSLSFLTYAAVRFGRPALRLVAA